MQKPQNDTVKSDGTISVTEKGSAFMPTRIRKHVGNDCIAYITEGNIAILFDPNMPLPELRKQLEFMQLLIIQRHPPNDTPCNKCLT